MAFIRSEITKGNRWFRVFAYPKDDECSGMPIHVTNLKAYPNTIRKHARDWMATLSDVNRVEWFWFAYDSIELRYPPGHGYHHEDYVKKGEVT